VRRPFKAKGGLVAVRLSAEERLLLEQLPAMLAAAETDPDDPAAERLTPTAHPDDPAADHEFRRLVASQLSEARRVDQEAFAGTIDANATRLTTEEAEVWLRVLGEARLVLAARLGIEHDGWTMDDIDDDPRGAVLGYLSYLQDSLVEALSPGLG
jgi:hypothetical protein